MPHEFQALHLGCLFMLRRQQSADSAVQLIPSYPGCDFQDAKRKKAKEWSLIMGPGGAGVQRWIETICDCGKNLKENSLRPLMAAAALKLFGALKYSNSVRVGNGHSGWKTTASGRVWQEGAVAAHLKSCAPFRMPKNSGLRNSSPIDLTFLSCPPNSQAEARGS